MVLSFAIPAHLYKTHKATSIPSTKHDERVLTKIIATQSKNGKEVQPYHFDTKRVDAFRYRMNDALRAVSQNAVRKARTRELKQELVKSDKLKRHFEENPDDLRNLRHDGEIRATKVQPHLKHVPQYLISPGNASAPAAAAATDQSEVPFNSEKKGGTFRKTRSTRMVGQRNDKGLKSAQQQGKRADPLKSFKATAPS